LDEGWQFRIARQETRSRQIILEGYAAVQQAGASLAEVFFLLMLGPDYLSLEVSREILGERLLDYLAGQLGPPAAPPRIIVGGHEEEGALSFVEWNFSATERERMIRRLSEILGRPLASQAPGG
jgi:hypothetical protein